MRIISGSLGGRRFEPPMKKWPTRPTTEMAREALFNMLTHRLDFNMTRMLDLFGGSGSHCFEAISRGCTEVVYVDRFMPCVQFVKKQSAAFNIDNYLQAVRSDVFKYIKTADTTFDYIFADPPYTLSGIEDLPDLIIDNRLLRHKGLLVIEHDQIINFSEHDDCVDQRSYGQTVFSFFSRVN